MKLSGVYLVEETVLPGYGPRAMFEEESHTWSVLVTDGMDGIFTLV